MKKCFPPKPAVRSATGLVACIAAVALAGTAQAAEAPAQAWPTSVTGTGSTIGATRTFTWGDSPYGDPGVSAVQTITSRVAAPTATTCNFMGGAGNGAGLKTLPNVLTYIEPDPPDTALFPGNCIEGGNGFVSSFVFNKPLIAPIFHFHNLDASRFAITGNSTTGAAIGLTAIVRNTLMDVSGTTLNNTVQPANQTGCNNNDPSTTPNGACGSFRITAASGLIGSLTLNNNATPPTGTASGFNDGFSWSVSFPTAPLTKQFNPASIQAGQTSQLTFSITNPNQSASVTLTPLDFTDNLPAGVTVASATATNNGSCGSPAVANGAGGALTVGATSVRATNISVAPGATCSITFTVTATQPGSYTNSTSNMSSSVGNLVPNASTTLTVTPQPEFVCDASMYLAQDSPTSLYRFDTSANPFVVNKIGATATFAYNATAYNPADNYLYAVRWNGTQQVLLRIGSDGSVLDVALISGGNINTAAGINTGEIGADGFYYVKRAENTDQAWRINLATGQATSITLSAPVFLSDWAWRDGSLYGHSHQTNILYRINPANGVVTPIGSTGVASAAFGALFGASNGIYGGNNNGGFYQFDLTTGAATLISNLPGSANNDGAKCPTTPLTFPTDLAITKTNNRTRYVAGETTYTIVVSNSGPFGVQGALVNDALPAGITQASWTCGTPVNGGTCGVASGTGAIANASVSLPVGASVTFRLTMTVPANFSGDLVNTATVTAPTGSPDNDTSNNTATDTDVQTQTDLAITKDDGATTYTPGLDVTYTIVATNNGPDAVTGARITDPLPAGITTASWVCSASNGGACGAASGTGGIDTTANLPVGASVTYRLSMGVPSSYTGSLTNTATVAVPAGSVDTNPDNNTASDTNTTPPPPVSGACSPVRVLGNTTFPFGPFGVNVSLTRTGTWQANTYWSTQGGNFSITYSFSQPVPVNWVRFGTTDYGADSYQTATPPSVRITFGAGSTATPADLVKVEGELAYDPSTGTLSYVRSGPLRQQAVMQGNSTRVVTSITLTATDVWGGDYINNNLYARPACLVVEKVSQGGTGSFTIDLSNVAQANGTAVPSTTLTTTAEGTAAASAGYFSPNPGSPMTLSEVVPAGWGITSATCTDRNAANTGNPTVIGSFATPTLTIAGGNVRPEADIVCRFNNGRLPTLGLTKTTRLMAGGPFGFALGNTTVTAPGAVSTSAADSPAAVDGDPGAGTAFTVSSFGADVTIEESSLPAGWLLEGGACTNSGGATVGSLSNRTYTIPAGSLAVGETFACNFTNAPTVNLRIDKTANPATLRTGEPVTYAIAVNNDGPGPGGGAVLRDPAVSGVDCSAATLSCNASGGAVCPSSLDVAVLQGTGLVIPTFPAAGALQFGMTCAVTASGQ